MLWVVLPEQLHYELGQGPSHRLDLDAPGLSRLLTFRGMFYRASRQALSGFHFTLL
jgi:hypothetical protein